MALNFRSKRFKKIEKKNEKKMFLERLFEARMALGVPRSLIGGKKFFRFSDEEFQVKFQGSLVAKARPEAGRGVAMTRVKFALHITVLWIGKNSFELFKLVTCNNYTCQVDNDF